LSSIVQPTESQLDTLVAPYLVRQQLGLGFSIGYASPEFTPPGNLYFAGNVQNQFGSRMRLDGDTLFELASISKTFTATLYALLVRSISPSKTVGDYIAPNGPLHISSTLADIPLDSLMNYTSGLPEDDENGSVDTPPTGRSPIRCVRCSAISMDIRLWSPTPTLAASIPTPTSGSR